MSYRRTNFPWAMAISQDLRKNGYDVFFDFTGMASGDFERVILDNIRARAHFIVLLTPSALERCSEPGDWLRREIETALDSKRNIVPLMVEGFDFATPAIAKQLTGRLAALKRYSAMSVPAEFFDAAMERLRNTYLNVPLDAVLHPASLPAREAAASQLAAAITAPKVSENELTAQQWFERGYESDENGDRVRFYTRAIYLKPDYAAAFYNRALARHDQGDLPGALRDYNEAIRLTPDDPDFFINRGFARQDKGDLKGALKDYTDAIRLDPSEAAAFFNRADALYEKADLEGALKDYTEAIRLKPDYDEAFNNRGLLYEELRDLENALRDYSQAIRLNPGYTDPLYNRALIFKARKNYKAAIADFQKYLENGGGAQDGDQREVERMVRTLARKLDAKPTQTEVRATLRSANKKRRKKI